MTDCECRTGRHRRFEKICESYTPPPQPSPRGGGGRRRLHMDLRISCAISEGGRSPCNQVTLGNRRNHFICLRASCLVPILICSVASSREILPARCWRSSR